MDNTKEATQKLLMKNKLLFICCILFIMASLFLTCYVFFFRTITIDVTKNVQLTFEGESGMATVSAVNTDYNLNQRTQQFLESITYQVSPRNQLSNGSVITITANYNEELASKYHIRIVNETKEITVSGLVERFSDAKQIDADFLTALDTHANDYFTKNKEVILQDEFTQFHGDSARTFIGFDRKYRVFLQALDRTNKDKIVDIYEVYAKGMVNQASDHEELKEETVRIDYMITYDDINSAKSVKDENIFGETIAGMEINNMEDLTQVLHQKYVLRYQITLIE